MNSSNDIMDYLGISTMDNNRGSSHPFGRDISTIGKDFWESLFSDKTDNMCPISFEPSILEFAQLALDVYDYTEFEPKKILDFYRRVYFAKYWVPKLKWPINGKPDPKTGFYAQEAV